MGQPSQEWSREIDGADAIVNLAGAGLADRRWTHTRKNVLRASRLASTRQLVAAIRSAAQRPGVLVQGSAVGYYGAHDDEVLDETAAPGSDFLALLARDWEAESKVAETFGCRVVRLRSGVVLAQDGGALARMLPPFRLGLGGPIASGRQYLSWIHRDDWVALVVRTLEQPSMAGAVNATSPTPVTNAAFTRALGAELHRPAVVPLPAFVLRALFGEVADVTLVHGQRVVPAAALDAGFTFRYPEIRQALAAALAEARG